MALEDLTVEVTRDVTASLGGIDVWTWRLVDAQGAIQWKSHPHEGYDTQEDAVSGGELALRLIESLEEEWEEKKWRDA